MDAYTLYAVNIAGTGGYLIDQVHSFGVDNNVQRLLLSANGQVDPKYLATMGASPSISFSTSMLATLLGKSSNAFLISGDELSNAGNTAECWLQKLDEGGTRADTGHKKIVVTKGLMVPRQIRAEQGSHATMDVDIVAVQHGSNDPLVHSTAALSGSPTVDEVFTLGPVKLNNTDLTGVQGITIDPGIELTVLGADGKTYPQYVAIMSRQPTITVTLTDAALLDTLDLEGNEISTSTVIYLRKVDEGGTRVAEATEEHISITVGNGMAHVESVQLEQGSHAVPGLQITPRKGDSDILVIDPTAAIA